MTARRLAPHELPGWPRSMGLELAAAYLGVSPTTLLALAGRDGPKPIPLTEGRRAWLKEDLDAWLDRQAGRVADVGSPDAWMTSLGAAS